jgi:hypothetical protein
MNCVTDPNKPKHIKWSNPVYVDIDNSGPGHARMFTKGVFLKNECVSQLKWDVQKRVNDYHEEQQKLNSKNISESIRAHASETDSKLIGIGTANKKIVAEQMSSSVGLCTLSVDQNF